VTAQPVMENERMVYKANKIAAFFEPYPEDKAVEGVAEHITKFWTPAMRAQLQDYIATGGAELHPLVLNAVEQLK